MTKRHKPKNDNQAIDPVAEIHAKEQRLRGQLEKEEKELSDERSSTLVTSALAVGGFALDWTFCGGLFTAIAAIRATNMIGQQIKTNKLRKQYKAAETDLTEVLKKQALEQPAPQMKEQLKKEFSAAAKQEMEDMQQRIQELEAQLGDQKKDIPPAPKVRIIG